MRNVIGLGVIALAVTACAPTPPHSDQLDEARTQVQALSQEPLAQ
ncbi:MAG TPA: hypothetical protein VNZ53_52930 [Steroidobacteraceae bacterium]|nr:hypothetical protein [Steroidobacteraceae bacterium]